MSRGSCPGYNDAELLAEIRDLRNQLVNEGRRDRIQKIEEQIEERRLSLATTPSTIDPGPILQKVPNPEYERVAARAQELRDEISRHTSQLGIIQEQIDRRSETIQFLEACKPDLTEIEEDLKAAKLESVRLSKRLAEVRLTHKLSADKVSNMIRIQDPTFPLDKYQPQRSKIIAAGAGGGFALGFALAFLLSLWRRRVHYPAEIKRILGVPVLAVIEEQRSFPRQLRGPAATP